MKIDITRTVTFSENRKRLKQLTGLFVFFSACLIYTVGHFFPGLLFADASTQYSYFFWAITILLIFAALLSCVGVIYGLYRLFYDPEKPLRLSPKGITCERYFKRTLLWEDIKSIDYKEPYRAPKYIVVKLNAVTQSGPQSAITRFSKKLFPGRDKSQFVLLTEDFVTEDFPIPDFIKAYAEQYIQKDPDREEKDQIFLEDSHGYNWFWKSKSVPEWKKKALKWFIRSYYFLAVLIPLYAANLSGNSLVAVEYWETVKTALFILVFSAFALTIYLFSFFKYHWSVSVLLCPVIGSVYALLIFILVAAIIPLSLHSLSGQKEPAAKEFKITDVKLKSDRCAQSAMKIENGVPFEDSICVSRVIRSQAKQGDYVRLVGEKSYWAFTYHSIFLINE